MKLKDNLGQESGFPKYRKSSWTKDEDRLLLQSIDNHGKENWSIVAQDVPKRNGKQCRERYMNHLCPALNHNDWNEDEDSTLLQQHSLRGNNWSCISTFLPGRSPNHVKNRFKFIMKKKSNSFSPDLIFESLKIPFFKNSNIVQENSPSEIEKFEEDFYANEIYFNNFQDKFNDML